VEEVEIWGEKGKRPGGKENKLKLRRVRFGILERGAMIRLVALLYEVITQCMLVYYSDDSFSQFPIWQVSSSPRDGFLLFITFLSLPLYLGYHGGGFCQEALIQSISSCCSCLTYRRTQVLYMLYASGRDIMPQHQLIFLYMYMEASMMYDIYGLHDEAHVS
jgi:hypothetical protein